MSEPSGAVVFAVRHGETAWTRTGQHTGRTDLPLTDLGCEQAFELSARLRVVSFEAVYSSPRRRALETARLAGFDHGIVVDDDLVEWDYGAYEGQRTDDIRVERPGWFLWRDGVPGGETIDDVAARADRAISRLRRHDGPVLVFAHGHFLRVFAARWLDAPPTLGQSLALSAATISVLGWEREAPAILRWNDGLDLDR